MKSLYLTILLEIAEESHFFGELLNIMRVAHLQIKTNNETMWKHHDVRYSYLERNMISIGKIGQEDYISKGGA